MKGNVTQTKPIANMYQALDFGPESSFRLWSLIPAWPVTTNKKPQQPLLAAMGGGLWCTGCGGGWQ